MARSRSRFVRPAPKTKVWIGVDLGNTVIVANATTLLGILNAAALALRPFTVLRTRLLIKYELDQQAVNEDSWGAFGLIVVSEEAAAIGATAVPGPVSSPDGDWGVYQPTAFQFHFADASGIWTSQDTYDVDSKAMRKVGANKTLAFMHEEDGNKGANIIVFGRMLIQLH